MVDEEREILKDGGERQRGGGRGEGEREGEDADG